VLSHQCPGACGGLGPDQSGGAEQAALAGQRGRIHGVSSLADRIAYQRLHRGERLGGLRGTAPPACWRGIGDGLQFALGVRAAKLMITRRVRVIR